MVGVSTFVGIMVATNMSDTVGVLIAIFGAYFAGLLAGNNQ
jgi:hypothetical protein